MSNLFSLHRSEETSLLDRKWLINFIIRNQRKMTTRSIYCFIINTESLFDSTIDDILFY